MKERLNRVIAAVRGNSIVQRVLAVVESANAVGAPLLATALAYTTMFAILPGVLLLSGVLGWVIVDVTVRADLLARLVSFVPPLAPVFADSLEGLVRGREALSIIGLVGLLWGASSFYAALDEVMRRLFPGGGTRSFLAVRLRGALAVLVLVGLVIGTVALGGVWTLVVSSVGPLRDVLSWLLPVVTIVLISAVVLATYVWVPTAPPTVRAALPPAIVAGIGIGLLTNLFAALAPVIVGGLSGFGVLTTVFAAFVWLNLCFQVLVWGAAWARYRRDGIKPADRPLTDLRSTAIDPPAPSEGS